MSNRCQVHTEIQLVASQGKQVCPLKAEADRRGPPLLDGEPDRQGQLEWMAERLHHRCKNAEMDDQARIAVTMDGFTYFMKLDDVQRDGDQ